MKNEQLANADGHAFSVEFDAPVRALLDPRTEGRDHLRRRATLDLYVARRSIGVDRECRPIVPFVKARSRPGGALDGRLDALAGVAGQGAGVDDALVGTARRPDDDLAHLTHRDRRSIDHRGAVM